MAPYLSISLAFPGHLPPFDVTIIIVIIQVTECVSGKPALVMSWTGLNPELPAIGLNSHMDVVCDHYHNCDFEDCDPPPSSGSCVPRLLDLPSL